MLNFTEHFLQMLKGQLSAFYPHSHYEFFSDNELTSRITESTVAMCPVWSFTPDQNTFHYFKLDFCYKYINGAIF